MIHFRNQSYRDAVGTSVPTCHAYQIDGCKLPMVPDMARVSNFRSPKQETSPYTWICQKVRGFASLLHLNMNDQLQKNSPISSQFPKKTCSFFKSMWLEEAPIHFLVSAVEAVGGLPPKNRQGYERSWHAMIIKIWIFWFLGLKGDNRGWCREKTMGIHT